MAWGGLPGWVPRSIPPVLTAVASGGRLRAGRGARGRPRREEPPPPPPRPRPPSAARRGAGGAPRQRSGMKEPSLPGTSLQRACRLLVAFCALHLSATLLYYLAGSALGPPGSPEPPPRRPPPANLSLPLSRPPPPTARPRPPPASPPTGPCPDPSPLLVGALRVEFSQPVNLDEVARINPEVKAGGRFAPKDCIALQKVAIIIPFRNREEHLKYWLYYLHPILQRQQLDYGVYVINQDGEEEFNRAKLLNIGFAEALKEYDYDCFVFSDVDLIPMDDRNTYKCYSQPRHLSVSMDKFGFRLPYNQYFGGVSALSKEQFTKINGFPNNYWGWGGEDDDIYNRLVFKGMGISRPDAIIGKCRMIRHSRDRKNEPNPERFDRIAHTRETMSSDGLNTLSYKVLRTDKYPLYTKITVDIGSPNS
ncbi:beta-1,4-galactosyltransferase 1 isoform X2 [Grus americana]|uniref:beta-1,4-galactosyltransferase 1 isoform X2 n=1 Tax=Grus americana TaxID=9117 RepID=UPI0024083DB9|nr:beta-1,4-galactosyltransferase 1 isoform X2 [Grus americana]